MNEFWQDSLRSAFKDTDSLSLFLDHPLPKVHYPLFIPKRLAEKIKEQGKEGALWKQFIPSEDEEKLIQGLLDPIGDHTHAKAPQLIHRYQTKALFLPTTFCPVQCRYCFRKNELHQPDELFKSQFEQTLSYLKDNPQISEIIFSGGDPLILSDQKLNFFISKFKEIKSIRFLRFHSRVPVILPERITTSFLSHLKNWAKEFDALSLVVHTNQTEEIGPEEKETLEKLRELPIHLLSQSVLLKGVNDQASDLIDLFRTLSKAGVKPYYLHHPDRAQGTEHFWISLEEGRRIYHELKGKLPGWMVPHYILDLPEGDGKTLAFNSESWESKGEFINNSGSFSSYFEKNTSF